MPFLRGISPQGMRAWAFIVQGVERGWGADRIIKYLLKEPMLSYRHQTVHRDVSLWRAATHVAEYARQEAKRGVIPRALHLPSAYRLDKRYAYEVRLSGYDLLLDAEYSGVITINSDRALSGEEIEEAAVNMVTYPERYGRPEVEFLCAWRSA